MLQICAMIEFDDQTQGGGDCFFCFVLHVNCNFKHNNQKVIENSNEQKSKYSIWLSNNLKIMHNKNKSID